MAKPDQPADPPEQPRLSDRQWEVLGRVVKGESVAPEAGKRIDLTLNSLVNRGLIERVEAPDKDTVHRPLTSGQSAFESHAKPAEPKATGPENKDGLGKSGSSDAPSKSAVPMPPATENKEVPGKSGASGAPSKSAAPKAPATERKEVPGKVVAFDTHSTSAEPKALGAGNRDMPGAGDVFASHTTLAVPKPLESENSEVLGDAVAFDLHPTSAKPQTPGAENNEAIGADGALTTAVITLGVRGVREDEVEEDEVEEDEVEEDEVEEDEPQEGKFVPRRGQIVWNLDGQGERKDPYYRVVDVGVLDAQLEMWSGNAWQPVATGQRFNSLEPLSKDELAEAKHAGVPVD